MESMDTFREKVHKSQVNYTSPLYARKIIRKFTPYVTRFLVTKTNITANQVTIWQLITSIIGLGLVCFADIRIAFLGSLLLHLGFVFDCVDGEIARYRKTQSINGMFLDFVNHEIIMPLTYACLCFHYYFKSFSISFFFLSIFIIVFKNNPIGNARQATIKYLIEKRNSPTYNIRLYPNTSLPDKKITSPIDKETDKKSVKYSTQKYLQSFKKKTKVLLGYPNDVIIITALLGSELIFHKDLIGKIFILIFVAYLLSSFIFDLWWHMKNRIAERDFFNSVNASSELSNSLSTRDND